MVMLRSGIFKICENDMHRTGNLGLKMGVSRAAHTQYHMHIWNYPPPPPRSPRGHPAQNRCITVTENNNADYMSGDNRHVYTAR